MLLVFYCYICGKFGDPVLVNILFLTLKLIFYPNRDKELVRYFSEEDDFATTSKTFLQQSENLRTIQLEWRLFIDNSKRILNCVLLSVFHLVIWYS